MNMKKYRILQKTNVESGNSTYTVQERTLFFFWTDVLVPMNWWYEQSNESPSLRKAEKLLEQLEDCNYREKYIKKVICTTR